MHALIFADNKYLGTSGTRMGILRAPGAHRIATLTRRLGIQTEVIDFFLDWTFPEIAQAIDCQLTKPTLFIAFSCSLIFEGVLKFEKIKNYIKLKNPNVTIIVGGNKTLQKGFVGADYYVEGPGEESMVALIRYIQGQSTELKYHLINGCKVLDSIKDYPVKSLKNLNIAYTPSDFISEDETLSLETARGCIFKCAFCDLPSIGKNKLDYLRDFKEVKEELLKNYQENGTTKYFVVEDTINDTDEKCELLAELGSTLPFKLSLMGYVRADLLISKPYNLDKLIRAGFRGMHFGIETFHEQAGKIIGKGMAPDRMKEGLINIKKKNPNLNITSTFIVGLPYETSADIMSTVDWLKTENVINAWIFNPLSIPTTDSIEVQSYFTKNYRLYGYSVMTEEEIAFRQNKLEDEHLIWSKNIIYWKNKTFDFISAAKFASEINQSYSQHKKLDGWTMFAISGLGIDFDELLRSNYNYQNIINTKKIIDATKVYISNYKNLKLKHFQNFSQID